MRLNPSNLIVGTRVQVNHWTCTRTLARVDLAQSLRMAVITAVYDSQHEPTLYKVRFDDGPQDARDEWRSLSSFVCAQPPGIESVYRVRHWRPPGLALVKARGWDHPKKR